MEGSLNFLLSPEDLGVLEDGDRVCYFPFCRVPHSARNMIEAEEMFVK